jgi:CBS domain-containing protein
MASVGDILANKGSQVISVGKDATVQEAALIMNEHRIGAVVVLEEGHIAGMFTERDVLRRIVVERRDPVTTPVSEVMTSDVICCRLETSVEEARGAMKNRRIRHLPVVDGDDRLRGLISIGDLNAQQASVQEQTIYLLHQYLYGRV